MQTLPARLDRVPEKIYIEPTTRCQLSCPSCPTGRGEPGEDLGLGDLDPSDLRALLHQNPGVTGIEMGSWGEPLLNGRIGEVLEVARAGDVTAIINSNMSVRRTGLMESVVENRVRQVLCSIDGASQKTYEAYRVGGSFKAVMENAAEVQALKERSGARYPVMIWKFIIFKHNQHEISAAREMAADLGMVFQVAMPLNIGYADGSDVDHRFSPPDEEVLVSELGLSRFGEYRQMLGYEPLYSVCLQLWYQPALNWNGDFLGCCNSLKKMGGNAFSEGLVQALNTPSALKARGMLTGREPDAPATVCSGCFAYRKMSESGEWLRKTPSGALGRRYIDVFGLPSPDTRIGSRILRRINLNFDAWSYSCMRRKFG